MAKIKTYPKDVKTIKPSAKRKQVRGTPRKQQAPMQPSERSKSR